MVISAFFLKFIKFCIVGASGMLVDFGVTYILKERHRVNRYVANAAGFMLAASSNFVLNRMWTFQSTDPHFAAQYFHFIVISVIGLAINSLVIFTVHGRLKKNFYVSKLLAIAVVTLWNFGMNSLVTFGA
ncbi:MAG: GtrA family protein [Bacteroidales bacterium]|jgi:putative flippase GtrA|nr:GtrA family protein [Bacteroidales bacterium]